MKTKHAAILDFQKKLILSATRQTRVDALNIYRIVAENLKEFVRIRLPEEPFEKIDENMDMVTEVYRLWATALIRRFPTLTTFNPFIYSGHKYVMIIDSDQPEPARLIKGENLNEDDEEQFRKHMKLVTGKSSDEFSKAVSDACEWATKAPKTVSVAHYWLNIADLHDTACFDHIVDEELYFGDDILVATPIYTAKNQAVYAFYWRYKILPDFANPDVFHAILNYLDGDEYTQTFNTYCWEYADTASELMVLPPEVIADPENTEIMLRTPLYVSDKEDGSYLNITALEAFQLRCDTEKADEIWMTIYRTDHKDDSVYRKFIFATAERLKEKFHVYIELMARGDSKNNVAIFNELKKLGADVHCRIDSVKSQLKVHGKLILAKVPTEEGYEWAQMISTGNFTTQAAVNYRDTFLISNVKTAKDGTIADAFPATSRLIQLIFGTNYREYDDPKMDKSKCNLSFAPIAHEFGVYEKIMSVIKKTIHWNDDAEVVTDKTDIPFLWIKVNNITEPKVINALLDAARAGVEIRIITRSSCSIPAQVSYPNLQICHVCGKYLEHDRFFIQGHYYGNPGLGGDKDWKVDEAYIMSADFMKRNLYKRVEVMLRVPDAYEAQVLGDLFNGLFTGFSRPENGFFKFYLTPSCWTDVDPFSLRHTFHVEYDNENDRFMDIRRRDTVLVPTEPNGTTELMDEVGEVFRKYGHTFFDASKFLSFMECGAGNDGSEADDDDSECDDSGDEEDHLEKKFPPDFSRINDALDAYINSLGANLKTIYLDPGKDHATRLNLKEMNAAVARAQRNRITHYLHDIKAGSEGELDPEYVEKIISFIMSKPLQERDAYISAMKFISESHIGANFFNSEKEMETFMARVGIDKLNKTYGNPVKLSGGFVLPKVVCDDETPVIDEIHDAVNQFWRICTASYADIDKALTKQGVSYADFVCEILPKYKKVIELSDEVTLEEVEGWISAYRFQNELEAIDRAGGPLEYAMIKAASSEESVTPDIIPSMSGVAHRLSGFPLEPEGAIGGEITGTLDEATQLIVDRFWKICTASQLAMSDLFARANLSYPELVYKILPRHKEKIETSEEITLTDIECWIAEYHSQSNAEDRSEEQPDEDGFDDAHEENSEREDETDNPD